LAVVLADIVNGADSRMVERGCGASLALKAFESQGIAHQVASEKLQGYGAAQASIFGTKHLPHAAAAERFNDSIV
jgi:hypothetical protein